MTLHLGYGNTESQVLSFTVSAPDGMQAEQVARQWAVKKINALLKDIERNGAEDGIGKPERLKGDLSDFYSRRIDSEHRLVYRITEDGFLENTISL